MPHQKGVKPIAQNKKAYHDYFVEETYECGLSLMGTEVKSMRQGKVNLKESFCILRGGEVFAEGMHISPYDHGKQLHDKRDAAAEKDARREIERAFSRRQDG